MDFEPPPDDPRPSRPLAMGVAPRLVMAPALFVCLPLGAISTTKATGLAIPSAVLTVAA